MSAARHVEGRPSGNWDGPGAATALHDTATGYRATPTDETLSGVSVTTETTGDGVRVSIAVAPGRSLAPWEAVRLAAALLRAATHSRTRPSGVVR